MPIQSCAIMSRLHGGILTGWAYAEGGQPSILSFTLVIGICCSGAPLLEGWGFLGSVPVLKLQAKQVDGSSAMQSMKLWFWLS